MDENDAAEFDVLLADVPQNVEQADQKKVETKKTSPKKETTESKPFMVKREWAKKAESDDDALYESYRRSKGIDSIKDLEKWTYDNVIKYDEGKLFQTLFESDDLFSNPGLMTHDGARPFVNGVVQNDDVSRQNNSIEFGFKVLVRAIVQDLFKEKARGLVLRNIEARFGANPNKARRVEFGKFLDEILRHSTEIEGNHGRNYTKLDKFFLEFIKEDFWKFSTEAKNGSYPIGVYCKEPFIIPKNKWLALFLQEGLLCNFLIYKTSLLLLTCFEFTLTNLEKHNAFCWENMTAMRYVAKTTNYNNLIEVFSANLADEYQEALTQLNMLIRDPTVLRPGEKSIMLLTPFNTGWEWVEKRQNIKAVEVWSENCQMSEITRPITMDQMIRTFLFELSDDSLYYDNENRDRRYSYQRSLRRVFNFL